MNFEIGISLVFFVVCVITSLVMMVISQKKQYENFEKETGLNLEQLTEKYNVSRNQILEKYNSIKFNEQTLKDEMSNTVNKTK